MQKPVASRYYSVCETHTRHGLGGRDEFGGMELPEEALPYDSGILQALLTATGELDGSAVHFCPSGLAAEFDGSLAFLFMLPSRPTLADINSCISN